VHVGELAMYPFYCPFVLVMFAVNYIPEGRKKDGLHANEQLVATGNCLIQNSGRNVQPEYV
jgi:hypothetical protein